MGVFSSMRGLRGLQRLCNNLRMGGRRALKKRAVLHLPRALSKAIARNDSRTRVDKVSFSAAANMNSLADTNQTSVGCLVQ